MACELGETRGAPSHLHRDGDGRLHERAVVAAVERHAALPEAAEELRQHLCADVLRLHALGAHALLHHLGGRGGG